MTELEPTLHELAEAYDIATEYWDWQGRHVTVDRETIVAVLAALGVDASTPVAAAQAVDDHHRRPWTQMLPPFLALREHRTAEVRVHVPDGDPVSVWIELETGGNRGQLRQLENWVPAREIDGGWVGEASFEIPADLPLGYHTLQARSGDQQAAMPLIISPEWLGFPERMGSRRGWGLATQLYSVRSRQSWGVGDLNDLEDLAVWSASEHGADYVLVNPLHAAEPVPPMEPSPYLPTSRRFANPLYLRVERIPEYAWATRKQRDKINEIRVKLKVKLAPYDQIDRDRSLEGQAQGPQDHLLGPADPRSGRVLRRRTAAAKGSGCRTSRPGRHSPRSTGRTSSTGRRTCRIRPRTRSGTSPSSTRTRSTSSAGCSGCWTSNWRPRTRPACGPE